MDECGTDLHNLKRFRRYEIDAVVWSLPIELVDIGLMTAAGVQQNIDYFVRAMEYSLILQRQITERRHYSGRQCLGDLIIFDLKELGWRHIDFSMTTMVVPILDIWQKHYPETLFACYIINAPRIFAASWKALRSVLDDRLAGRVFVYADDREGELRPLLSLADDCPLPWGMPHAKMTPQMP